MSSLRKGFKIKTTLRDSIKAAPTQGVLNANETVSIRLKLSNYNLNEVNAGIGKLIVKYVNLNLNENQMSNEQFMDTWKNLEKSRLQILELGIAIKDSKSLTYIDKNLIQFEKIKYDKAK